MTFLGRTHRNPLAIPLTIPMESLFPDPQAAYVHLPFCHRRCFYCDFPIRVIGDRRDGSNFPEVDRYVQQLCQEITHTPNSHHPLETVFFGGGTPSLLTPAQLGQILTCLHQTFGFQAGIEISMELDPGTFDRSKLMAYQALGVNRFSLGIQSFDELTVQRLGRAHTLGDSYRAIATIQDLGLSNWSLDLISGLPQQTLEQWHLTLETALHIAPPHLSVYDLVVEPGTVFGKGYEADRLDLPPDDLSAQFYRQGRDLLTQAGYDHYEISNYARPGHHCRHNLTYWQNQSYYGFGLGATSYHQGRRIARPRTSLAYHQWVQDLVAGGDQFWQGYPITSPLDWLLDTLMLRLRLRKGLELAALRENVRPETIALILETLKPHQDRGWVTIPDQDTTAWPTIALTDPEGFLFSNQVLADLFEVLTRKPN